MASKDGIDRLSNLPDSLLSHILSLLPTEYAVATSVLSTRWRFLWTSITNLNFDEQTKRAKPKNADMRMTQFTRFVDRVLLLINPPCVQNFRLKGTLPLFDHFYPKLWITSIEPTVQELDLCIFLRIEKPMVLPLGYFHFNKLVVLKLEGSIHFNIPAQASLCFPCLQTLHLSRTAFAIPCNSSVSFPNLMILHLHSVTYPNSVDYPNHDSVCKLFSSCPVLDDLFISGEQWDVWDDNVVCFIICMPYLTSLTLKLQGSAYEIKIDTLAKLKFLSISSQALKAFGAVSAGISSYFHNLKRLELEVVYCCDWSDLIKNLLERMDNLEHLFMKRRCSCSCSRNSWWTEPLSVPKCVGLRVTTISFTEMKDDCGEELELVRYFLRNAKVLQLLKLDTGSSSSGRKLKLIEKISMFPKGSDTCQVVFT